MALSDTRHLFNGITLRKPTSWDDMSPKSANAPSYASRYPKSRHAADRLQALRHLPRTQVHWDSSPMDEIWDWRLGLRLEWIVERLGGPELQMFYVNNEGFGYARHAYRIDIEEMYGAYRDAEENIK